jgi:endo-1,4-beta-xylanase
MHNPASGLAYKGTVVSDGSLYKIYKATLTDQPSIQGTATFQQYWSIRQRQRTNGTVTTANHFNAWRSLGLDIGTFNFQIVATKVQSGKGAAVDTVS